MSVESLSCSWRGPSPSFWGCPPRSWGIVQPELCLDALIRLTLRFWDPPVHPADGHPLPEEEGWRDGRSILAGGSRRIGMAKMRAKVRARALQMSPDQYFQAKQAQTLLWEAINELDKHEPVGRMRNVVPEDLEKTHRCSYPSISKWNPFT